MIRSLEMLRATDEAITRQHVSFHELVERHKKALYYLSLDLTGNHHDAEDLSQDVFIRAHKGLAGFRGDSTTLTWLRRIAVNTYLNQKRKKSWSMLRFLDDQSGHEAAGQDLLRAEDGSTDESASKNILRAHIDRALNRLSPREKTAFVLRHFNDLSTRETSEVMGTAEGTIKSLLFRATKKMQDELADFRSEIFSS